MPQVSQLVRSRRRYRRRIGPRAVPLSPCPRRAWGNYQRLPREAVVTWGQRTRAAHDWHESRRRSVPPELTDTTLM